MSVVYQSNSARTENNISNKLGLMCRLLVEDVYRNSLKTTPMKYGDLRKTVNRRIENNRGIIEWTAPYAAYQERGMRADGSHVVRNYTTPGTGKHYAKDAVIETLEKIGDYARKAGL